MFIKIPFESTLDFKTNIYEITKMSLEHDYNVSGGANYVENALIL